MLRQHSDIRASTLSSREPWTQLFAISYVEKGQWRSSATVSALPRYVISKTMSARPSLRMSTTQNASVKRFGASQVSFVSSRSNLNLLASSRQQSRSNLLSSSRRSMLALEKQQQEKDKDRAPAVQVGESIITPCARCNAFSSRRSSTKMGSIGRQETSFKSIRRNSSEKKTRKEEFLTSCTTRRNMSLYGDAGTSLSTVMFSRLFYKYSYHARICSHQNLCLSSLSTGERLLVLLSPFLGKLKNRIC